MQIKTVVTKYGEFEYMEQNLWLSIKIFWRNKCKK